MADYLLPREDVLEPVRAAADDAMKRLGLAAADLESVVVAGLHQVDDSAIASALGVPVANVTRQADRWADLGYAAGMLGVAQVAASERRGVSLVVSAGGLGFENAFAAVVNVA